MPCPARLEIQTNTERGRDKGGGGEKKGPLLLLLNRALINTDTILLNTDIILLNTDTKPNHSRQSVSVQ